MNEVFVLDSGSQESVSSTYIGHIEDGEPSSYEIPPSFNSDSDTLQLPTVGEVSALEFEELKPLSRGSMLKLTRKQQKVVFDELAQKGLEVKKVVRRRSKSVDFQIGRGRTTPQGGSGSSSPVPALQRQRSYTAVKKGSSLPGSGNNSSSKKTGFGGLFSKFRTKTEGSPKSSRINFGSGRNSGVSLSSSAPTATSKAAKLLGISPSTSSNSSPATQRSSLLDGDTLLTKEEYDRWVETCFIPWEKGEKRPQTGQALIEFFREGAGVKVYKDYERWLEGEGQKLAEVAKTNNWRQSFRIFLISKTSETGRELIESIEEESSSVVILPRSPRKSLGRSPRRSPKRSLRRSLELLSSEGAVEETEESVSITGPRISWLQNPTMQAFAKVLKNHVGEEKVADVLNDLAHELDSKAIESEESGQEMLQDLMDRAKLVQLLRAQVAHQHASEDPKGQKSQEQ